MISERQLAAGFSGFWQDLLPLLTPRFVSLFNEGYIHTLEDASGIELNSLPLGVENEHPAIVAEMAFFLAKLALENSISATDAAESTELCEKAAKSAVGLIDEYEGEPPNVGFALSAAEINEAASLAKRYDCLYPKYGNEALIEFSPLVPGAGFMPACHGDLAINETLFEIKTVNRNLSGKDLRQLIIYLALQASTRNRRWTSAGFFNPRRGTVAEFTVDTLIFRLSGGRTPSDVFDELVEFASTRDALFDTIF